MTTRQETHRPEPTIDEVVKTHTQVAQERLAARTEIPVKHEGGPIKITVRAKRLLGAAGALGIGLATVAAFNLGSNGEESVYKGPLHVVTADDGSRTVEGVYDVKKGDTIWDVAAQVNGLGGVKGGEAESQLLKTHNYLIFTGGGIGEDGSSIPIQDANTLSPGQDILVHDFKVSPEGKSQFDLTK